MATACKFNPSQLSFAGSSVEQARCLLRFVKRAGEVGDTPATLPQVLENLLADAQNLGIASAQLTLNLQKRGIPESTVGGPVGDRVCHADSDNPSAPLARYFMIHDTSTKLKTGQTFDPDLIDSPPWTGNQLAKLARGKTHIYITRLGQTLTDHQYKTPWRATQFEGKTTRYRGLFLHHELVQPRMGPGKSDVDSPDPGFTPAQYERLALQYIIASVRRGSWMIPAFHCVLDIGVGDHDDPQHFDLAAWGSALQAAIADVRSHSVDHFAAAAALVATDAADDFKTPPAKSATKNGKGGSTTTGLRGKIRKPAPDVVIIDATETLTAFLWALHARCARCAPQRTARPWSSSPTTAGAREPCPMQSWWSIPMGSPRAPVYSKERPPSLARATPRTRAPAGPQSAWCRPTAAFSVCR